MRSADLVDCPAMGSDQAIFGSSAPRPRGHMIDRRVQLLASTPSVLREQQDAAPQKDEFCGSFWGAVVLRTSGVHTFADDPVDQDTVAVHAGTLCSRVPSPSDLPPGERSRTDYRLPPTVTDDSREAGTAANGLGRAVERISDGGLSAIPIRGPWSVQLTCDVMTAALSEHSACLLANVATAPLWYSHAEPSAIDRYLETGVDTGESSEWQVGHFVALLGWVIGPGGRALLVADTYLSLGRGGIHLQAIERVVTSLQRPGLPAGGLILLVDADRRAATEDRLRAQGAELKWWDNGSRDALTCT